MENFLNGYFLRVIGAILLLLGLVADCCIGIFLLNRMQLPLLLIHFPVTLGWAVGVNLVARYGAQQKPNLSAYVNKWGLTALLPGLFSFPGLWPFAYSFALLVAWCFRLHANTEYEKAALLREAPAIVERSPSLDWVAQPAIETLHHADTQSRLMTVAKLSRYANPETTRLLRQLLSDPRSEIRSDASIALTRLEDQLSHDLHTSFEQWAINPADQKSVLALADQYYQYAQSNVLDHVSQRFYLEMARNLLVPLLAQEYEQDAVLWLRLARIRQSLGEIAEALANVRRALQIKPDWQEASLLAMELAFRLHSWGTFVALTDQGTRETDSETTSSLKALQWWTTLHASQGKDVLHD